MDLDAALNLLARDADPPLDVAEVALHLARDEYPTLDVEGYLAELEAMAREAKRYVRGDLTARVRGLCRYLFHDMGFRGNQKDYYDPLNSYLNQVMERRTGIPITLSALAIAVGRRAGLKLDGIGLPGHFIVAADEGLEHVLFDPFHGGRLLTQTDCENVVQQATKRPFQLTEHSLDPLPLTLMVMRMLNNLKALYLQRSDLPRATRVLKRLRQIAPDDPELQRDLGICLVHGGKAGQAISLLADYLRSAPDAMDAETIAEMLNKARATVAQWN